jgi:hypothetical protein
MDLVDCFNVSCKVPSIHEKDEFKAVLQNFKGDKQTIERIAEAAQDKNSFDGISIKNLILAIEISL